MEVEVVPTWTLEDDNEDDNEVAAESSAAGEISIHSKSLLFLEIVSSLFSESHSTVDGSIVDEILMKLPPLSPNQRQELDEVTMPSPLRTATRYLAIIMMFLGTMLPGPASESTNPNRNPAVRRRRWLRRRRRLFRHSRCLLCPRQHPLLQLYPPRWM